MPKNRTVTLKQLRALDAVHRSGSIAAAAEMLNLTAPAVSTQLKMLETNMGAELLIRAAEGKGSLTAQGQVVLAAIHQIETALEHCFKTVDSLNAGKSGYLTLGVVSTAKYWAPMLVALARRELGGIHIDLVIGNRQEIISALESHSVDLAIMGRPPRYPAVESTVLGDHPHIMIAPPDHPLVGRRDIMPEELLEETFILRERGAGTRILLERYLDRIGEGATYDWLDYATNETIKQAVIAGLGIALISAHTVTAEVEEGRIGVISMPTLPIVRQWYVVRPVAAKMTPVIEQVLDFLIAEKDRYIPSLPQSVMV